MAKAKYILEVNRPRGNGTFQILLKITHNKKNTTKSIGIYVKSKHFIEDEGLVSKKEPNYEEYNQTLNSILSIAKRVIDELELLPIFQTITVTKIKQAIDEAITNEKRTNRLSSMSFAEYWNDVRSKSNESRKQSYTYSLQALLKYNSENDIDNFNFSTINTRWVESYVKWLYSQGYKQNTVWTYYKDLKAVINDAVDNEVIPSNILKYFKKVKVKQEISSPYSLPFHCLRSIHREEFESNAAKLTKKLFLFSFCTIGMNLIDIYNLDTTKFSEELPIDTVLENDIQLVFVIKYKRQKTGKDIRVRFHGEFFEALGISCSKINDDILFNLRKHYKYSGLKTTIRRGLKEIAKELGIQQKFTFYTARDSWATIAANVFETDTVVIDKALSHSTKSLADRHYIDRDYKVIDDLNLKIVRSALGACYDF